MRATKQHMVGRSLAVAVTDDFCEERETDENVTDQFVEAYHDWQKQHNESVSGRSKPRYKPTPIELAAQGRSKASKEYQRAERRENFDTIVEEWVKLAKDPKTDPETLSQLFWADQEEDSHFPQQYQDEIRQLGALNPNLSLEDARKLWHWPERRAQDVVYPYRQLLRRNPRFGLWRLESPNDLVGTKKNTEVDRRYAPFDAKYNPPDVVQLEYLKLFVPELAKQLDPKGKLWSEYCAKDPRRSKRIRGEKETFGSLISLSNGIHFILSPLDVRSLCLDLVERLRPYWNQLVPQHQDVFTQVITVLRTLPEEVVPAQVKSQVQTQFKTVTLNNYLFDAELLKQIKLAVFQICRAPEDMGGDTYLRQVLNYLSNVEYMVSGRNPEFRNATNLFTKPEWQAINETIAVPALWTTVKSYLIGEAQSTVGGAFLGPSEFVEEVAVRQPNKGKPLEGKNLAIAVLRKIPHRLQRSYLQQLLSLALPLYQEYYGNVPTWSRAVELLALQEQRDFTTKEQKEFDKLEDELRRQWRSTRGTNSEYLEYLFPMFINAAAKHRRSAENATYAMILPDDKDGTKATNRIRPLLVKLLKLTFDRAMEYEREHQLPVLQGEPYEVMRAMLIRYKMNRAIDMMYERPGKQLEKLEHFLEYIKREIAETPEASTYIQPADSTSWPLQNRKPLAKGRGQEPKPMTFAQLLFGEFIQIIDKDNWTVWDEFDVKDSMKNVYRQLKNIEIL